MESKLSKLQFSKKMKNLLAFILKYVKSLKENSVLVVTSKIMALAEGRVVNYKNEAEKIKLIKAEK